MFDQIGLSERSLTQQLLFIVYCIFVLNDPDFHCVSVNKIIVILNIFKISNPSYDYFSNSLFEFNQLDGPTFHFQCVIFFRLFREEDVLSVIFYYLCFSFEINNLFLWFSSFCISFIFFSTLFLILFCFTSYYVRYGSFTIWSFLTYFFLTTSAELYWIPSGWFALNVSQLTTIDLACSKGFNVKFYLFLTT